MPFYEYRCQACGCEVEELQKFSDPALTQCPSCNKQTLEKVISTTGFQLTGTGWYVTDFKDKKPQTASSSESSVTPSQPDKKPAQATEGKSSTTE